MTVKIVANNPDGLSVILTGVKIGDKVQPFTTMRGAIRSVVSMGWEPVGMVLSRDEDAGAQRARKMAEAMFKPSGKGKCALVSGECYEYPCDSCGAKGWEPCLKGSLAHRARDDATHAAEAEDPAKATASYIETAYEPGESETTASSAELWAAYYGA